MDWNKQIGRLIGPLAFIVLLLGGTALVSYGPDGAEVAGDFASDYTAPRVLAVRQGSASPTYVSFTMKEMREAKADPSQVSFLLPADTIYLRGGDFHRVTVMERHADWQLVEYKYARGKWESTFQYRAFKDRVEAVHGRVANYLAVQYMILFMAIPALIGALFAHHGWKFYLFMRFAPRSTQKAVTLMTFGVLSVIVVLISLYLWLQAR
jgi:hypothetical protein